ncbi:MAG: WbuC family cupin fold metalloprotein [Desulfuromonadales bacterium]|nr:WbuC family cupin fold metalloprotein [Desulfuromonadales bacterium]NIR34010.1 WbuC family cupin fold metalloprotein [Desulfuromonadales bacterium]NIS41530.1 WbuC family cupin fold metalloprotein [Desulfuromonadales bacterium]
MGDAEIRTLDARLLDELSQAARRNERRRQNFNIHASYDEPCQRLLNAVEPYSYIRPHRHLDPAKPETFIAVRGRFAILIFSDGGDIHRIVRIGGDGEAIGLDIPAGTWHSVLSLDEGAVFFETKPGPYHPLSDKDWAPWAPPEGSEEAAEYLQYLQQRAEDVR